MLRRLNCEQNVSVVIAFCFCSGLDSAGNGGFTQLTCQGSRQIDARWTPGRSRSACSAGQLAALKSSLFPQGIVMQ